MRDGCKRTVTHKRQPSAWMPDIGPVDILSVDGFQRDPVVIQGTAEVAWADNSFDSIRASSPRLNNFLSLLESRSVQYCVFGGWLRDTLAARTFDAPLPRDVDLVTADIEVSGLISALPTDIRPTMFGGVQSAEPPVPFDVWPLHETFLIRRFGLPATFESLLLTADFNINSALYFPNQRSIPSSIFDAGMLDALRRRILSFNGSHLPFPIMQCSRLAAYAAKLDLDFDATVLAFMQEMLRDNYSRTQVIDGLRRFQPEPIAKKAMTVIELVIEGGH